eukprot:1548844-Pleurochrysis_carterae.AAC.4
MEAAAGDVSFERTAGGDRYRDIVVGEGPKVICSGRTPLRSFSARALLDSCAIQFLLDDYAKVWSKIPEIHMAGGRGRHGGAALPRDAAGQEDARRLVWRGADHLLARLRRGRRQGRRRAQGVVEREEARPGHVRWSSLDLVHTIARLCLPMHGLKWPCVALRGSAGLFGPLCIRPSRFRSLLSLPPLLSASASGSVVARARVRVCVCVPVCACVCARARSCIMIGACVGLCMSECVILRVGLCACA